MKGKAFLNCISNLKGLMLLPIFIIASACTITFDNLSPGTEYHVNDIFYSSYISMRVEKFCWANGQWTDQGVARVMAGNYSGGSGNDVNLNNVNLYFALPYPVKNITLNFGDYGGNENIVVNGFFTNVKDFAVLNMVSVSNVTFSVNMLSTNVSKKIGILRLDGTINEFKVGGQELWIDNVSFQK